MNAGDLGLTFSCHWDYHWDASMNYNSTNGVTTVYKRLTIHAPRRMSEELQTRYVMRPWTVDGVLAYQAVGGWFSKGQHDFADMSAARAAGVKEDAPAKPKVEQPDTILEALTKYVDRLSREERNRLLSKLQ